MHGRDTQDATAQTSAKGVVPSSGPLVSSKTAPTPLTMAAATLSPVMTDVPSRRPDKLKTRQSGSLFVTNSSGEPNDVDDESGRPSKDEQRSSFVRGGHGSLEALSLENKAKTSKRISDAELEQIPPSRRQQEKPKKRVLPKRPASLGALSPAWSQAAAASSAAGAGSSAAPLSPRAAARSRGTGNLQVDEAAVNPKSRSGRLDVSDSPLQSAAKPPISPRGPSPGSMSKKEEKTFLSKMLQL